MAVRRFDAGSLRPPKRLADGRLRVDAYLTRTGVFEYLNPDGTVRREYRPAEEVFHADSLSSFEAVAFTDEHPIEPVTASNAKTYAVGWLGESVRRDGEHVVAPIYVADTDVIGKIEAGKREVSCGYECDLEMVAGVTPDGQRYDAIQRNIRGNHVALVERGRAGSARVRMDAAVMIPAAERGSVNPDPRKDPRMDELQKKLDAALADLAKVTAERDVEKTRADKAEAQRDSEKSRADKAEQLRKDADDGVAARVAARVDLERKAVAVLDAGTDVAKMTDREVRVAVVKRADGIDIAAEKSDAYVEARFDAVVDRAAKTDASLDQARIVMIPGANPRLDIADEDVAAQKMRERTSKAWKPEGK